MLFRSNIVQREQSSGLRWNLSTSANDSHEASEFCEELRKRLSEDCKNWITHHTDENTTVKQLLVAIDKFSSRVLEQNLGSEQERIQQAITFQDYIAKRELGNYNYVANPNSKSNQNQQSFASLDTTEKQYKPCSWFGF